MMHQMDHGYLSKRVLLYVSKRVLLYVCKPCESVEECLVCYERMPVVRHERMYKRVLCFMRGCVRAGSVDVVAIVRW